MFNKTISIVGGTGHVGLPLGLFLAKKNYNVKLIDINLKNIKKVNNGMMPFKEEKAKFILKDLIKKNKLHATNNFELIKKSKFVIICIGTPVNSKLKPETKNFLNAFRKIKKYISKNSIIVIRSSVYPGISNKVYEICKNKNRNISYCPERIVQGKSLIELPKLPQIISGFSYRSINESVKLFSNVSKKL